jgi:hypothetical protein
MCSMTLNICFVLVLKYKNVDDCCYKKLEIQKFYKTKLLVVYIELKLELKCLVIASTSPR